MTSFRGIRNVSAVSTAALLLFFLAFFCNASVLAFTAVSPSSYTTTSSVLFLHPNQAKDLQDCAFELTVEQCHKQRAAKNMKTQPAVHDDTASSSTPSSQKSSITSFCRRVLTKSSPARLVQQALGVVKHTNNQRTTTTTRTSRP